MSKARIRVTAPAYLATLTVDLTPDNSGEGVAWPTSAEHAGQVIVKREPHQSNQKSDPETLSGELDFVGKWPASDQLSEIVEQMPAVEQGNR